MWLQGTRWLLPCHQYRQGLRFQWGEGAYPLAAVQSRAVAGQAPEGPGLLEAPSAHPQEALVLGCCPREGRAITPRLVLRLEGAAPEATMPLGTQERPVRFTSYGRRLT